MANNNNNTGEPSSAPQAERWYELKLGSSFKDHSITKFCTLRYEFKPASIDNSQPGSLHKNKENRVMVDFHNNQPGKPQVSFEGSSEDYRDNNAVLFFDGQSFLLKRVHRAVKRLRHVRMPGESSPAAASSAASNMASAASVATSMESLFPLLGKFSKTPPMNKTVVHSVLDEVERIDIGELENPGTKATNRSIYYSSASQIPFSLSSDPKLDDQEENIDIDDGFDINIPTHNDTDDEIADVDVNDDEAGKEPNAAEALKAQVTAEDNDNDSSSSSGSSGSGSRSRSSRSGSGSSSSDSNDDDSASSCGEMTYTEH